MGTKYLVGTNGFHYDHWRERFYPQGLPKSKWLEFYTQHFPTVELNISFYRLPSEKAVTTWREVSPADFTFAVKVSQFITHIKRLKDAEEPLLTFLSRARILRKKLGPLLYQLPPSMVRQDEVLEEFLSLLPGDLLHVFEFRHESWLEEGVFALLRRHGVGFCLFDMPRFPCLVIATADFAYLRFHGSTSLYSSCYSDKELADWAGKIAGLRVGEVYIYFNNDIRGFALNNAKTLVRSLEMAT